MSVLISNPGKPQGAQRMVHYPSILRFDPLWYSGLALWSDNTSADIALIPSTQANGGVSQNANLTLNTLLSNAKNYWSKLYRPTISRSVANAASLKITAPNFANAFKSWRAARYATLNAASTRGIFNNGATAEVYRFFDLIEVDSTHFIVLYERGSSGLRAICGVISAGAAPTWGAEVQITTTGSLTRAVVSGCLIDTNKIAVVSQHTSSYAYVTVCTLSSATITVGTPVAANAAAINWCRICKIGTGKFFITYCDGSNNALSKAATTSGTVPTLGSEQSIKSSTGHAATPVQLTTDKVAVMYGNTTSNEVVVCTISTTTVTVGSASANPTAGLTGHAIYSQATDKFIVMGESTGASNVNNFFLFTVATTTITLASRLSVRLSVTPTKSSDASPRWFSLGGNVVALVTNDSSSLNMVSVSYAGDVLTAVDFYDGSHGPETPVDTTYGMEYDAAKYTFGAVTNGTIYGRCGSYDIICGTTSGATSQQMTTIWKGGITNFYNNTAQDGDVLIVASTPAKVHFMYTTQVLNSLAGGDEIYLKATNASGAAMCYEFADIAINCY